MRFVYLAPLLFSVLIPFSSSHAASVQFVVDLFFLGQDVPLLGPFPNVGSFSIDDTLLNQRFVEVDFRSVENFRLELPGVPLLDANAFGGSSCNNGLDDRCGFAFSNGEFSTFIGNIVTPFPFASGTGSILFSFGATNLNVLQLADGRLSRLGVASFSARSVDASVAPIPEPTSWGAMGWGALLLVAATLKRRSRTSNRA